MSKITEVTTQAPLYELDANGKKVPITEKNSEGKTVQKALSATINYDYGDGLEEKIELFGEKGVEDMTEDRLDVILQNEVRRLLRSGYTEDEIQSILYKDGVNIYKPGQRTRVKVSAIQAVKTELPSMTDEEKKALVALLMGKK